MLLMAILTFLALRLWLRVVKGISKIPGKLDRIHGITTKRLLDEVIEQLRSNCGNLTKVDLNELKEFCK